MSSSAQLSRWARASSWRIGGSSPCPRRSAQPCRPRQLRGLRARVFALGSELPAFLHGQMPILFSRLPAGSLWYVATDPVLLGRFAFLRSQLALRLTPDIPMNPEEFEGLRLLDAH